MTINDLLKELRIDKESYEKDGKYIIDLEDSDGYARVYTKLDKSELVDLDVENVVATKHSNVMTYLSDEFDITLEANFDSDTYRIIIEEVEE